MCDVDACCVVYVFVGGARNLVIVVAYGSVVIYDIAGVVDVCDGIR